MFQQVESTSLTASANINFKVTMPGPVKATHHWLSVTAYTSFDPVIELTITVFTNLI